MGLIINCRSRGIGPNCRFQFIYLPGPGHFCFNAVIDSVQGLELTLALPQHAGGVDGLRAGEADAW